MEENAINSKKEQFFQQFGANTIRRLQRPDRPDNDKPENDRPNNDRPENDRPDNDRPNSNDRPDDSSSDKPDEEEEDSGDEADRPENDGGGSNMELIQGILAEASQLFMTFNWVAAFEMLTEAFAAFVNIVQGEDFQDIVANVTDALDEIIGDDAVF